MSTHLATQSSFLRTQFFGAEPVIARQAPGFCYSGFQFRSDESNYAFTLVVLYYALWLVRKTCTTFSTNEKQNQNQSCLGCTLFPALGVGYMYLLRVMIGSLHWLPLLWLARVKTLVLVLRRSSESRSIGPIIDWFIINWFLKVSEQQRTFLITNTAGGNVTFLRSFYYWEFFKGWLLFQARLNYNNYNSVELEKVATRY